MASDAVAIANVSDGHEGGPEYTFMTSHVSTHGSVSGWIVDSGATSHMSYIRTSFQSYHVIAPANVILGDGTVPYSRR